MGVTRTGAKKLARLRAVRDRTRTLARNHEWFAEAIRVAFTGQMALIERHRREMSAMDDLERRLARELLTEGRLIDPRSRDNSPCLFVDVRGLCPIVLVEPLGKYGTVDIMPRELERDGAAAALAALERDTIYHSRDLPKEKRDAMVAEDRAALVAKTHVSFSWMIVVSQPADWQEPANPQSLHRADLGRFTDADYLTIALYRLGGLADVGKVHPLVPKPKDTGDMVRDVGAYAAWRYRLPIDDAQLDQNQPRLSVRKLPPDVAEQLLEFVEIWAKREEAKRGESLTASGSGVSPDLADGRGRGVAAADPDPIDRLVERVAAQVVKTTKERKAMGIGGTDTDWKDVQGRLLAKRERGEPYTSLRKLCSELGCSEATIRKAIGESETLTGWQARSRGPMTAPKATDLNAVVRANTRQTTEPALEDVLPDDDVDATMVRLLNQAKPAERAKLNALDNAGRRALVAAYQAQNLDAEPSPLEPDKPGEGPRKVRQHKRI